MESMIEHCLLNVKLYLRHMYIFYSVDISTRVYIWAYFSVAETNNIIVVKKKKVILIWKHYICIIKAVIMFWKGIKANLLSWGSSSLLINTFLSWIKLSTFDPLCEEGCYKK